jgi:signal transduction histidine kinase/ActR/RegA family two-component response regulator
LPDRAFRRELRRGYFAPFLAMALLAGVVLWRVTTQVSSVRQVEHTYQVIQWARHAQSDLLKMMVSISRYLVSRDERYLAQLPDLEKDLDASLAKLSVLVADNPDQGQRVLQASSLKGIWIGAIQTFTQMNPAQPVSVPLARLDEQVQAVSDLFDQIVEVENQLLRERTGREQTENRSVFFLVPLLSGLAALTLAYRGWNDIRRASKQFAAALKKAEEANRAKDNFLATVSHELRNPLNSILLTVNILGSNQKLDENARRRVKAIERSARAQAQLIEDLLDISRIEGGRLRLDVQAVDLAQVVKSAVESMRLAAEAKSITLTDIIDTSAKLIAGDPKRMEQIVWNLLSNAIKFTPKGGKVQVRLERINSHVEIIVTDNGKGIPPSSLPYVFDRFWQEAASGQNRPGIGLGLSIIKELVALHGGTVMAHSDGVGKGSVFTVRLPLPPASAPLLEPRRHPTVASFETVTTAARLDGLSLLVVDDDSEAREALTNLLGSLGATVNAESSAPGALSALDRVRPDAIIADIEMPVQDGFYLAREVRKREQEQTSSARVPMLAVTAYGRVEDKVKILASGFDGHVVKPVDLAELSATIRSLVASRAA